MRARSPERDPVRRLSELLRREPRLLVERWERLAAAKVPSPADRPVLHGYVPALIDLLAARLERGAKESAASAATDEALHWSLPCEEMPTPADLCAALDELGCLRTALFDLSEGEGVRLTGRALRVVHEALDDALTAAASAIARCAVAAATREREQLDMTLRLLPVGVFITDARGRFLTMNDAAARLWGPTAPMAESAADYGAYRTYRPGTNEPLGAEEWALARALRGESPVDEDVEIVTFDGDRRTIVNSALALHDPEGNIMGGVAVNVDVTDRKRVERQLAAIIEGALDAIVLMDASGRITEFNAAAERTFGYARSEAIGRELAELIIEPELREAHRRGLRRYLTTGESTLVGRRVEMRAMHASGTLFDTELTVIRLPTRSSALFAGFLRDITDRKRTELERAREAELRERLIGIVGHDLRTPLAAILFSAQSLLRQEALSEPAARGLARIVTSAGRMDRIIHDLLDFARTRHGGIPVSPAAADLVAICRHVIEEVELTHRGRAVELCARGSAEGQWDLDRMAQVVQNLVVNALDYSPADTNVEVAIDDAGERVVLAVHNGGAPIPKEMLPHIFDPFRRGGHEHSERATRGLGLGLYIANEIVRAHHGRISVVSDGAAGTTFVVELPRATPRAA